MFLHSAKVGDTLTAEATEVYNHHKIPYVDVRITNQRGELCCVVTGLAYRKDASLPVEGLM
jgi:acyl-CoA thioesterase